MLLRPLAVIALGGILLAGLTACSSATAASDGVVTVVASTDVYGDIASQIGGSSVKVTSIINDPSQDPHSYEGDARVQLALSQADVVIKNGGGYDDFVGTLLAGANNPTAAVVDVATLSGLDQHPSSGTFNEHLWYDFPTMKKLVSTLASKLAALDPGHGVDFRANAKTFTGKLTALEAREAAVNAASGGDGVAITEPVPLYLLSAAGLVNRTPPEFSQAVEEGTDVPPAILQQTLALFSSHTVR
ncbi:MAG: zinc/manganese transport system substrate-binding protein, partial [Actinomycetota bacterium]|nr:zinc/manganese transport system substrate-binding protein [Actinomycetota bacterium]